MREALSKIGDSKPQLLQSRRVSGPVLPEGTSLPPQSCEAVRTSCAPVAPTFARSQKAMMHAESTHTINALNNRRTRSEALVTRKR